MRMPFDVARKVSAVAILGVTLLASACATAPASGPVAVATSPAAEKTKFEKDRKAIIAQTGDYRVRFDFIETVSFKQGYTIQEPDRSGGYEVVRVIEDTGNFISIQHILVIEAGEDKFPIKHWRQDWRYEPESVLVFIGGNAWENRKLSPAERKGKWSQTVYQVEDSPRYGAVGEWKHEYGVSAWTPPAELRPLPRREATKRDDYYAVLAVNRHALTPDGWVHEQDNSKVAMIDGEPRIIAREQGVNTYRPNAQFDVSIATKYWDTTKDYWALVRKEWSALEASGSRFALTVKGEPEPIYTPLLALASDIEKGKTTTDAAIVEARKVIAQYTTTNVPPLAERLAKETAAAPGAADH